jgi:hypothetical protein
MIPLSMIGIANGKFVKNNGFVGELFAIVENAFIYCLKYSIVLFEEFLLIGYNKIINRQFLITLLNLF